MSLAEDYGDRFISNIEGVFVAVVAGAFAVIGETMAEVTEPTGSTAAAGSVSTLLFVLQNYPTFITLGGFLIVAAAAGPFGLVGFLLEVMGANIFLSKPVAGMVLFAIGTGLIVIGARLWKWRYFLELIGSSSRSRRRKW